MWADLVVGAVVIVASCLGSKCKMLLPFGLCSRWICEVPRSSWFPTFHSYSDPTLLIPSARAAGRSGRSQI